MLTRTGTSEKVWLLEFLRSEDGVLLLSIAQSGGRGPGREEQRAW